MSWTQGLNPEQARAVEHNYGPMLILAGAGSGKTTVLVSRTGRLIEERVAAPEEILVLTFTNKAARELKHRVSQRLGAQARGLWAGTFHSFGLRFLKIHAQEAGLPSHFGVIDASDAQSLLREILREVRFSGKDRFDLGYLLELINQKRAGQRWPPDVQEDYADAAELLGPKYERRLETLGFVDFEDLLIKPRRVLEEKSSVRQRWQEKIKQIMVDEFQDTNRSQMDLLRALLGSERNISVVGDDDQAIYGWRGAMVSHILNFPREFAPCEVVKLERNYRSSSQILALANAVIAKNTSRHGKVLRPEAAVTLEEKPELFHLENEEEEAEFVVRELQAALQAGRRPGDLAVLYRSNTQGGLLEGALRRQRLDYTISGGTSIFERKEAKDAVSYLRLAIWPDDLSLRRVINTPSRGIGEQSLEKMSTWCKERNKNFLQAWREAASIDLPEKAVVGLQELYRRVLHFREALLATPTPGQTLIQFMKDIGYAQHLRQVCTEPQSVEKRWMVVEVIGRILDSFISKRQGHGIEELRAFIEAMVLREEDEEDSRDKIQLMTLH
ncbi:MAG: ATP-dependent helicase, partial [Bdellovibrionaceae bacterium]|nr:ATP-dependent helicase [Pseudobdellovibrionaceae bacterium]